MADSDEELEALLSDDDSLDPFDDSESDPELEEGEDDREGSDDEPEDDEGASAKSIPYKRFQKAIAQRNEERAKAKHLEEELESHQEFLETLGARYKKFKKPAAQLAVDADFMEALERMAQTDQSVKTFYDKVTKFMESGVVEQQPTKSEPKSDPRLDEILKWKAQQTVTDTLHPLGLEPKYTKLIQQHILANAKDPGALDADQVRDLTKSFMRETGFTLKDMKATKADPVEPKDKPKTTHQKSVAATTKSKLEPGEKKTFKNREELLRHRESLMSDLIAELETPAA